jgi:hypothetical protein
MHASNYSFDHYSSKTHTKDILVIISKWYFEWKNFENRIYFILGLGYIDQVSYSLEFVCLLNDDEILCC